MIEILSRDFFCDEHNSQYYQEFISKAMKDFSESYSNCNVLG